MSNFQSIPFDNIIKLGQSTLLETDLFTVSWILGRFCNYNCSYCWPYARSDIVDYQELKIYIDAITNIKKQANENGFNNFHFSFSGGEPTAYKNLLKLIDFYQSDSTPNYQSLHLTTNLSPAIKWWNKFVKNTNNLHRISITASFHAEFANEDEFADKCLYLIDNNIFVTINQVMVPEQFDSLYERCERFFKLGINVTLKPQSNTTATQIVSGYTADNIKKMQTGFVQQWKGLEISQLHLYDKENKKYLLDQAERLNTFGFNKFKGWKCNAGYQGIIIKNTEVKRSYSCKEQNLGDIVTGFKINNRPNICITDTCVSSADSKIPKEK